MTAKEMWALFSRAHDVKGEEYEAWAFGGDPDQLARLVLGGVKTATASACPLYEQEGEPLPRAGEYSVILDAAGEAVCVIRSTKVTVIPFHQVSPEHAWKEGEGDRSLDYWRQVHEEFFRAELTAAGMTFTEEMPVVCEEFERLYP